MVLELHAWGPAFGLPSIDPFCLATIAFFQQCLKSDDWILIPSNDPLTSPLGELPALKDGDKWISGFANIVRYLGEISAGDWAIDDSLNAQQRAQCTAFVTFIESRGLPLLDLLLYVSSENYNSCTKPALAEVLAWPSSWVVPGRLRKRAKRRSEHLGLSGLDVDTIEESDSKDGGLTAQIPASLRRPKQTVTSILGRDMRKNKFRLDAVNEDFLDPLEEALGQKQWLFGDSPSTSDCLAVSVLALLYLPADLPHPWVRSAIDARYPRLARWTNEQAAAWFQGPSRSATQELPRHQPAVRSWKDVLNAVITTAVGAMPVLGPHFVAREVEITTADSYAKQQHQKQVILTRLRDRQLLYSQVLISSLSLATLAAVLVWKGVLSLPQRNPKPHFRGFGEAGNMLGLG